MDQLTGRIKFEEKTDGMRGMGAEGSETLGGNSGRKGADHVPGWSETADSP